MEWQQNDFRQGRMMDKRTIAILLFLVICVFIPLVFFSGYYVRSIHYKQDVSQLGKAQEELRLKFEGLADKDEIEKLADLVEKYLQEKQDIVEFNRENPIFVFGDSN